MTAVPNSTRIILIFNLLISEYTFNSSIRISAENVMVTIFAKESLKNVIEKRRMTDPWKIDFHTQMKNVLKLSALPFCSVLYSGGNFRMASTSASSSNTNVNTGREV